MRLTDFLYTPFPRPKRNKKNLLLLILIGMSASLFILVYNPFGIKTDTGQWYLDLVIIGLGVLFILSVLFMEIIIPAILPGIFKNWTLGKAIIWYMLVFVFIAAMNFLYKSFWSSFLEFSWTDFILVLGRTLVISFTVCFFVLGLWQYLNRRRITSLLGNEYTELTTESGKIVELRLNDILYISSDDNYVDVHYYSGEERKKIVLRSSLRNAESQLVNKLSPIIRCHRQYLINPTHFSIEKKSSRSLQLKLKNYTDEIPVSRRFVKSVMKSLSANPK